MKKELNEEKVIGYFTMPYCNEFYQFINVQVELIPFAKVSPVGKISQFVSYHFRNLLVIVV